MSRDMIAFSVLISIFLVIIAIKLFKEAIFEWEKSKTMPTTPVLVGTILILLIILMIYSAIKIK